MFFAFCCCSVNGFQNSRPKISQFMLFICFRNCSFYWSFNLQGYRLLWLLELHGFPPCSSLPLFVWLGSARPADRCLWPISPMKPVCPPVHSPRRQWKITHVENATITRGYLTLHFHHPPPPNPSTMLVGILIATALSDPCSPPVAATIFPPST